MFKKILTAILASVMLLSVAACGEKAPASYAGTLEVLADAIYAQNPLELAMGPTTQIDIANADTLKYYLGLSDAAGVKEAVFSEPMIGSIPYSLCLIRVTEDADIAAVSQSIFDGIDTRKWMCVEADQLIVAHYADIILMVMANSENSATLAGDMCSAFSTVIGGEVTKLEK